MKKENEKYHKTFMDKLIDIIILFGSLCIVALFVFIYSITVNASSATNTEIPYIVPNWRNANSCIPDTALENAQTRYINDVRNYFHYSGDLSYLVFVADGIINNGQTYQIFFITNPTITESYPDKYDYHSGTIKVKSNNVQLLAVNVRVSDNYVTGDAINLGTEVTLCGSSATVTLGNGNMTSRYPFLMVGTDEIKSSNDKVIFTNITPTILPTGEATPPDEFNSPVYPQGHAKPQTVPPTYTVNNYTWTTYTPPVVDNSTLEKLVESLTDIVKYNATYLKDNLHNEFTNLIDNIKGLIEYIGETIQYYGDLIIDNIQNLITTFYNNMVSIGQNITDKLTYIVSPLDTSALQTAIENTGIYNDYDRIFDMVGDAFGFYNDITEPNTFTIPIDLRNVTILHQTQIIYIDLGWLNSCKTIIRAFMWCVLTFGLLYTIIDSIPDYIQGNDE